MFRVKICGLTTPEDAAMVAAAGADAVGLNFYPKSPRFVAPDQAAEIVHALPAGVVKVGLFVDAPADEVCRNFDTLGLDLIQLHGDEPPGLIAQLSDRPVMRAFRVGPEGLAAVESYLAECNRLGCPPGLVLIDACVRGVYGGSGALADWDVARRYLSDGSRPPLVLAGGLSPENVAEAVRAVRPAGVDTASGVESSPGRKDPALVRRFVAAAREAFALDG